MCRKSACETETQGKYYQNSKIGIKRPAKRLNVSQKHLEKKKVMRWYLKTLITPRVQFARNKESTAEPNKWGECLELTCFRVACK